jgi:tRNA dimethylallyltransferase
LDNSPPGVRARLDSMELRDLLQQAKKLKIDLSDIDLRNKRRVIRAIESGGQKPTRSKLLKNSLIVGLQLSAEELRQSVGQRVDKMLAGGLEEEVRLLAEKYGWDIEPMKGIGYREWRGYFEGRSNLDETRQRIVSSTLGLAKRQRTWFKRDENIQWFSSSRQAYSYVSGILST